MTPPADDLLAAVTALVPHLRWRVGPPEPSELDACTLIADPDAVAHHVAGTAPGRGSDDPQVLGSLWWQAYGYRVAGTTLAAWAVSGAAPDPAAATGVAVGVARSRPSSVVYGQSAAPIADIDQLASHLFAQHLDPLAVSLRARHQLGEQLLWGDVAAGIASALGAVEAAEGAPPLRDRIAAITEALPHDIASLGDWEPRADGAGWSYRRRTCCLWWKTTAADGAWCEDCSLIREERP